MIKHNPDSSQAVASNQGLNKLEPSTFIAIRTEILVITASQNKADPAHNKCLSKGSRKLVIKEKEKS